MSHFTYLKTRFQNLFYLQKALSKLNIVYKEERINNSESSNVNLVIPQSNGYDTKFCWNGQEYDLAVDITLWNETYSIESFIDKIGQQYAGEVIIGESQKIGFQPVKYQQNVDGSQTLILERWNS